MDDKVSLKELILDENNEYFTKEENEGFAFICGVFIIFVLWFAFLGFMWLINSI